MTTISYTCPWMSKGFQTQRVDADLFARAKELVAGVDGETLTGFAEACYNDNTVAELVEALNAPKADRGDMESWGLTASEWRDQIRLGLAAHIATIEEYRD